MGADPTVWGVRLPIGAVYRWLFAYVPGFNGLRVPARFSTVVLLALAVLASVGFARIVSGMRPRARIAACAAALAIILLEGTGGAMPLAFLRPTVVPIARRTRGSATAEPAPYSNCRQGSSTPPSARISTNIRRCFTTVPSSTARAATTRRSRYSWAAPRRRSSRPATSQTGCARCGRPVSARSSCIRRRLQTRRPVRRSSSSSSRRWRPGPAEARWFPRPRSPESSCTAWRSGAKLAAPAGDVRSANGRTIPPSSFVATSSHAADRLERAFDGNIETRWVSGERQSGTEWIDVAFDRPRDVARVRILTADRSLGDYPRELIIEAVDGASPPVTLYRGTIVQQLVEGPGCRPAARAHRHRASRQSHIAPAPAAGWPDRGSGSGPSMNCSDRALRRAVCLETAKRG